MLAAIALLAPGCRVDGPDLSNTAAPGPHPTTLAIDAIDELVDQAPGDVERQQRINQRWVAVQRAVAHHGTTHRDAFYGSRAYWHTDSTTGLTWAIDQRGDLDDSLFIDGRGNVRIAGDANADIEVRGNAIVHILGDLDATLELAGVCEVIVAGRLTDDATIICDGQLELFVGGVSEAILGSTGSSTIVIDDDAAGVIQCGAPGTALTVTGAMIGELPPPQGRDSVLTLRVDGYMALADLRELASAGFTRVNATIGLSDTPAGVYPADPDATLPTARWVVLEGVSAGDE